MKEVKLILLATNQIILSQIEEVSSELGEPDCKLIKPFDVNKSITGDLFLQPFLIDYTKQDIFMISSDKIITLSDPTPTLLEKYIDLIKE